MEEIYTFAVVPKTKQQIFFLVKRRRVKEKLDELKQIIARKIRVNDHNCFYEIS
uniref:Uncharacterized protein n=1 Tax=Rhizophagus irregularis (strain DAOM 181602 / DAOM 197198 / MUCL 43194) TaxID=747089 RepID=U9T5Q8_RHIID